MDIKKLMETADGIFEYSGTGCLSETEMAQAVREYPEIVNTGICRDPAASPELADLVRRVLSGFGFPGGDVLVCGNRNCTFLEEENVPEFSGFAQMHAASADPVTRRAAELLFPDTDMKESADEFIEGTMTCVIAHGCGDRIGRLFSLLRKGGIMCLISDRVPGQALYGGRHVASVSFGGENVYFILRSGKERYSFRTPLETAGTAPEAEDILYNRQNGWFDVDVRDDFLQVSSSGNLIDAYPAERGETDRSFAMRGEKACFVDSGAAFVLDQKDAGLISDYIELREARRAFISLFSREYSCAEIDEKRDLMAGKYDAFVERHGCLHRPKTRKILSPDASFLQVLSLETVKSENGKRSFEKSSVFDIEGTVREKPVSAVETPSEALAVSLQKKGLVDPGFMSALLRGRKADSFMSELLRERKVYLNPEMAGDPSSDRSMPGYYIEAGEFLSGYLWGKIESCEKAARICASPYERKQIRSAVSDLKDRLPAEIPFEEIGIELGSPFVPERIFEEFFKYFAGGRWRFTPKVRREGGVYTVELSGIPDPLNPHFRECAISGYSLKSQMQNALNGKPVVIRKAYTGADGKRHTQTDKKRTMYAADQQKRLAGLFRDWCASLPGRDKRLIQGIYNKSYNGYALRAYDGSKLVFPGSSSSVTLMDHQKDAAARILYGGNCLLAHPVGFGKTYTMIAAAMEARRMGTASKIMMVVPKAVREQTISSIYTLYPGASVCAPNLEGSFSQARIEQTMIELIRTTADITVLTADQFRRIPESVSGEIRCLEEALKSDDLDYKSRECFKERIRSLKEGERSGILGFDALGVDMLFVDECHAYKNLRVSGSKGFHAKNGSKVAEDMWMKASAVTELRRRRYPGAAGCGLVFASGTPVSNAIEEVFVWMKYLIPENAAAAGIITEDNFLRVFCQTEDVVELNPTGTDMRVKNRVVRYKNLPELLWMTSLIMDNPDLGEENLPQALPSEDRIVVEIPNEAELEKIMNGIADAEQSNENILKLIGDGRKAALDVRLFDPALPAQKVSKVTEAAENIYREYLDSSGILGTQLVFCDLGVTGNGGFSFYAALRDALVEKGIPENEIAFVQQFEKDTDKEMMQKNMNSGKLRVLIGSTSKCGTGLNVQKRLVAFHEIDVAYRPSDHEQRRGRAIRQGNTNRTVRHYIYLSVGSMDAVMLQIVQRKSAFISQVMRGRLGTSVRETDEIADESTLSVAELKAIAIGDNSFREKIALEQKIIMLQVRNSEFLKAQTELSKSISKETRELEDLTNLLGQIRRTKEKADRSAGIVLADTMTGAVLRMDADSLDPDAFHEHMRKYVYDELRRTPVSRMIRIGSVFGLDLYVGKRYPDNCAGSPETCFFIGESYISKRMQAGRRNALEQLMACFGDSPFSLDSRAENLEKRIAMLEDDILRRRGALKPSPYDEEIRKLKEQLRKND